MWNWIPQRWSPRNNCRITFFWKGERKETIMLIECKKPHDPAQVCFRSLVSAVKSPSLLYRRILHSVIQIRACAFIMIKLFFFSNLGKLINNSVSEENRDTALSMPSTSSVNICLSSGGVFVKMVECHETSATTREWLSFLSTSTDSSRHFVAPQTHNHR